MNFLDYNALCPLRGGKCIAEKGCAFAVTINSPISKEHNHVKCAIAVMATNIHNNDADMFSTISVGELIDE